MIITTVPTITNSFVGAVSAGGAARSAPPVTITNDFDAAVALPPTSSTWWAVLVDCNGTTVARMPQAVIGSIVETLNDIDTAEVTIPIRSRAGDLIDARKVLPELEVQIWRGNTLWLWGPIIDAVPRADHFTLSIRDARWHLTRRHIGELGGKFGGKPPYFHDSMVNERFERGDISGWSVLRTISMGEFVGFGAPDPSALTIGRRLPSREPMVRCAGPLDPLDNYQLFQDLKIFGPQNGRQLRITFSGWWYIPSGEGFAPNNQRMGLLLSTLIKDASLPADYYQPEDNSFTALDDLTPRDTLFYQECELELRIGVETLVHVSVCFPQGVSYVGGLEVQVDDGLLYNESPSTIGPGLVMHAQDPYFAKDDVNIDWTANTVGDQVIREYQFNDHTNIGSAIASLSSEGWFDWDLSYSPTNRWADFTAPRGGGYRPSARCRVDADGRGNVDRIERRRMWSSGSTKAAAQTRSQGNHERAATVPGRTLEEVFVAPREPKDYELPKLAQGHLQTPEVVEVQSRSGDERFLLGLQLGDVTDVLSSFPGHRVSGRHRVVRRDINPGRDSVTLTLNPEG